MAYAKMTQGQLDSLIHVVNDKAKISDMATQLGAKADLVSGKVPLSQLPSDIGGGKATFTETNITATAGQTVFSATYTVGAVEVYMNGVKMTSGVDFTATNGTSITLTSGATVGDEISVLAYSTFAVADTYTKSETDVKLANKVSLSGITAYHLLEGSLSLSNTSITNGFSTTLYTGNGTTQSINTGVDMATQWGNDASETFGGLVWLKSRSNAQGHNLEDTVRGIGKSIVTSATTAEASTPTGITSFNNNGFTTGGYIDTNTNTATYASWNFQTTHRISGTTNHGKAYTCHYNPYTGFAMVKYEGSGIAGHEIPHHLGRKLGFWNIKNLTAAQDWATGYRENYTMYMNATAAEVATAGYISGNSDTAITTGTTVDAHTNASTNQYIMYGWANSYYDEANTLIGNYEVGVYQGTGAAGNKVKTRAKPAWVMVKRLDSTGNWVIQDNKRSGADLFANTSSVEGVTNIFQINSDGFQWIGTDVQNENASGGQYLYLVVYDNDSGSGKSKYPKALDNAVLNLTAKVPFANGVDASGTKVSILSKNETVSGVTLSEGKNYVYAKNDGTFGVSKFSPNYNQYNGFGDYLDVNSNKWYQSPSVFADDFSTDSGWVATNATKTFTNGDLTITNVGTAYGSVSKSVSLVIGKKYKVVGRYGQNQSPQGAYFGIDTVTNIYASTQDFNFVFVATVSNTNLTMTLANNTAGYMATWDNIAVYPIKDDGSVDISNATPITESRNYLNAVVYADQNGQPTYVEQLPKTQYVDEIKANEFKGKNACTAWVSFDGTTTPPTIRDSYNVASVVRTSAGIYDVYFATPMDNLNYTLTTPSIINTGDSYHRDIVENISIRSASKVTVTAYSTNTSVSGANYSNMQLQVFGGRN